MGKIIHEISLFARAEVSASISSIVDFGLAIGLNISGLLTYGYANLIGVTCGGIANCCINSRFVFRHTGRKARSIAFRYVFVWLGSMTLNGGGTNLATYLIGARYFIIVKAVIACMVALLFNYPLQRRFVFKNKKTNDKETDKP